MLRNIMRYYKSVNGRRCAGGIIKAGLVSEFVMGFERGRGEKGDGDTLAPLSTKLSRHSRWNWTDVVATGLLSSLGIHRRSDACSPDFHVQEFP